MPNLLQLPILSYIQDSAGYIISPVFIVKNEDEHN
jgi:hypothetical protein